MHVDVCSCVGINTSAALKMEAVCSTEKLIPTYKSTRRYSPEEHLTAVRTSNIKKDVTG
jgi:hypothetical protein